MDGKDRYRREPFDPDGYEDPVRSQQSRSWRLDIEELPTGQLVVGGGWRKDGSYREWLMGVMAAIERELAAYDLGTVIPFDEAGPS